MFLTFYYFFLAWLGEESFPVAASPNEETVTETTVESSAFIPAVVNDVDNDNHIGKSSLSVHVKQQVYQVEIVAVTPSANSPQQIDNLFVTFELLMQQMTEQQKTGMSMLFHNEVFFLSGFLQQVHNIFLVHYKNC